MNTLPDFTQKRPKYQLILPSTDEKIEYSPYTTEDEKNILIAAQEKDYGALITTLESVIKSCTNIVPQTIVDFSYLAFNIRAKSYGSSYDYTLKKCDCGYEKVHIHVDNMLDNIEIKNKDNLKDTYTLFDDVSLRLVPTKIDLLKEMKIKDDVESSYTNINSIIAHSIDYVAVGTQIYKDFSKEELTEKIIKKMTPHQKKEVNEKIGNMIKSVFKIKYVCPGCEKEFEREINDFLFLK